jgi:predicted porin
MRILPFFQYSKSSFTVQKVNVYGTKMDSTLTIEEYIAGFNVIVKRINSNNITAKVGYIDSSINDECVDNSGKAKGLQLGIGYEMKIFRNSRLYINYSYDFLKLSDAAFRDYDIQKITFGFML